MYKAYRATEVQNNFGYYMARAIRTSKPVYIQKHGKPIAVILGLKTYEACSGTEPPKKSSWVDACSQFVKKISTNRHRKSSESSVELVGQLREEENV